MSPLPPGILIITVLRRCRTGFASTPGIRISADEAGRIRKEDTAKTGTIRAGWFPWLLTTRDLS
jgi:hypothetical protein